MASRSDTVKSSDNKTNLNDSSSTKVPSKEPTLKFNMVEYRELKKLESAGDIAGVQDLKKKVLQRMESASGSATTTSTTSTDDKKTVVSKQVKTTTSSSSGNVPIKNDKNDKNTAINHKRPEATISKNSNMVSNEDKKVAVKKVKSFITTTSKSPNESSTINKEKFKEKPKSFTSSSRMTNGNVTSNKVTNRQEKASSLSSTSKGTNGNLFNNKSKQVTGNKEKTGTKISSNMNGVKSVPRLETFVELWKLRREKGEKYKPLELFLPPEILNNKDRMVTVEKIAKEFELERLRRLLEQDKEKPNGNKKLAQGRIENLNNFGKNYSRLEIAALRNEKGPKKDHQIRAYITFLNEKNIIKHKKITSLDVIEDPNYLKKGIELFKEIKQNKEKSLQRKEMEKPKDLERKRKFEEMSWQERLEEERKHKRQHKLEVEKKREKPEGNLVGQKRRQESMAETKRRHEEERERARRKQKIFTKAEVQHHHNRIEDLRSKHGNAPNKMISNRSELSKSTSLKKRTFDERSPYSRVPKRNVGGDELDIYGLDEATVNQNISSIIHSIVRPGRRPIYGIVDDNDDDVMEASSFDVFREEARSSRLAKKEDEDEERAEQQRRLKKLNRKKAI
ncbi:hypothetical protein C1645_766625 [Glomus cerebriforme]|uniref:Uncharacterized protein n=1 Tax=Glomus cerebriforme TaxID=658196 RepID=A0A397T6J2_9GLOM|nr:hypothetical protein C1645_766625 [Glomus cerebriforme]